MDERRFDELARHLAGSRLSRRATARRLLGAAAAGLVAALGTGSGRIGVRPVAAGVGDATCRAAAPAAVISKNGCGLTSCGTAGCLCVVTVGHIRRCVNAADVDLPAGCPTRDECDAKADCPPHHVCAKVEGCCRRSHNKCVRACAG